MVGWLAAAAMAAPGEGASAGVRALREGRYDDAFVALSAVVAADPSDVEAWWELGWACWSKGELAAAAEAWGHVEALAPNHPDLGVWLGAARERARLAKVQAPTTPPDPTPAAGRLRFVAGGDTMMGSELSKGAAGLPPGHGETLFTDTKALFLAADVAFLNVEGPIADDLPSSKCPPGSESCYAFRTPARYAEALTDIGLDLGSLANNHAFDVGPTGQQATMAVLDARGIAHAGRWGDVAHIERNGVKIAMVAAHSGVCCLSVNDVEEVKRAVADADRDADIVVFAYHGGKEGAGARHVPKAVEIAWGERRGDVYALSHAAVDAGADLVLGTGPHVLRAMEVYQGRLIAYSLGNYVGFRQFGTSGGYGGRTVLLDAELASNGVLVSARLHPLAMDAESVPHTDPTQAGCNDVRELSAADFPETGVRVADDCTLTWGPK